MNIRNFSAPWWVAEVLSVAHSMIFFYIYVTGTLKILLFLAIFAELAFAFVFREVLISASSADAAVLKRKAGRFSQWLCLHQYHHSGTFHLNQYSVSSMLCRFQWISSVTLLTGSLLYLHGFCRGMVLRILLKVTLEVRKHWS